METRTHLQVRQISPLGASALSPYSQRLMGSLRQQQQQQQQALRQVHVRCCRQIWAVFT